MSDDVRFLRQIQSAKESSKGVFSDTLGFLLSETEKKPLSILYLNYHNPLIQKLLSIKEKKTLKKTILCNKNWF